MTDKKTGLIDVGKALMNISFAVFAAVGAASGNIPLVALSAIPLAASQTIGPLLARSKSKQDETLELPPPSWWTESIPAWQGLCKEIEDHLPDIFQNMAQRVERTQGVATNQVVRQAFIDAVTNEPLVWESDPQQRRRAAEYIATPLLQKMSELLKAIVDPIRQETALVDIHGTAANTAETVAVLEKIYEEIRKQGEHKVVLSSDTPSLIHQADVTPAPAVPTPISGVASAVSSPQDNINDDSFDVFLCYNSADRAAVERIAEQLEERGVRPWFDKWELIPGRSWQQALATQIKKTKSAAVFVGKAGMGPWHQIETEALLRQFADRRCPVIPVLLPGFTEKPDLPGFLGNIEWVDFNKPDDEPTERLISGITGHRRPRR
jgi:hypothetical protein